MVTTVCCTAVSDKRLEDQASSPWCSGHTPLPWAPGPGVRVSTSCTFKPLSQRFAAALPRTPLQHGADTASGNSRAAALRTLSAAWRLIPEVSAAAGNDTNGHCGSGYRQPAHSIHVFWGIMLEWHSALVLLLNLPCLTLHPHCWAGSADDNGLPHHDHRGQPDCFSGAQLLGGQV